MISTQEATINALDKVSMGKIDFKKYLLSREQGEQHVKSAGEFRSQIHQRVMGLNVATGAKLPWEYTHERFRFRPGEVTLWFGVNGHKKSMVTGFVATDLMGQGHKVVIASLEMAPASTLGRMLHQASGTHVHLTDGADRYLDWCEDKLWVYDRRGTVKVDAIMGMVYYSAEQLGATHIFIDSLMKCVRAEDDYNAQKDFIDGICSAAIELKIHIHVVHHSKKLADNSSVPGKFDAKGSGSIIDQVDNAISVFQVADEKKKDRDSPDHVLGFLKQRNGEWEGQLLTWFDRDSLQFLSRKDDKASVYVKEDERNVIF